MSLQSLRASLGRLPVVGLVAGALQKSRDDHGKDMAASIAFFTFFSIFPLFLGLIALGSLFMDSGEIQGGLDGLFADAFPGSADFVRKNVQALTRLRGAAGFVSIVGLLWSASKMFGAVSRGVNRALDLERNHPIYLSPLRQFLLTITVSLVLFLVMAVSTGVELFIQLDSVSFGGGTDSAVSLVGRRATSYLFTFVMLGTLYSLVPYERPKWTAGLTGALFASLLFELGKLVFVLYLDNVGHLKAIYGPVSSIIVLLLWLYFSARVLLFGAELIAAYDNQDTKAAEAA